MTNKRSLLSIFKKEILKKKNTITKLRNSMNNSRFKKSRKINKLEDKLFEIFQSEESKERTKNEESLGYS